MDNRAETLKNDIISMLSRMNPRELSMVYSLARHIDTRTAQTKGAPRQ